MSKVINTPRLINETLYFKSITNGYYDYKMSSEEINDLVKQLNHPDQNFCNDPEELTSRIYDQDLAKDIQTYGGDKPYMHGTIYSINSYQEAKNIALKLWEEQYENTKHKLY